MFRHGRQTRLVEVGTAGQDRIEAACVEVGLEGLAAQVAVRYLVGAGIGCLRVADEHLAQVARSVDPVVHVEIDSTMAIDPGTEPIGLRDPVARDLARGAYHALRALRTAIGMTP